MSDRPGALVISLDFELHWGVRDHHQVGDRYEPNLRGARPAVPRILELFERFEIAATWAVVGFLFARSRNELEQISPAVRPAYQDPKLSPYHEAVGSGETDDPLHFAPSLIELIRSTPRQEIATHTFSHYYCTAGGQDETAFRADLASAVRIAEATGITVRSIVFPRNHRNPSYDLILREMGIEAFRGNPQSLMWQETRRGFDSVKRISRLVDAYLALGGDDTVGWEELPERAGLVNVRASRFLRPWSPILRFLEPLRLRRIRRSMEHAARHGRIYHLWWHPHNFGRHIEENLSVLRKVLMTFANLRQRYGMESLSMDEVASRISGRSRERESLCASSI